MKMSTASGPHFEGFIWKQKEGGWRWKTTHEQGEEKTYRAAFRAAMKACDKAFKRPRKTN